MHHHHCDMRVHRSREADFPCEELVRRLLRVHIMNSRRASRWQPVSDDLRFPLTRFTSVKEECLTRSQCFSFSWLLVSWPGLSWKAFKKRTEEIERKKTGQTKSERSRKPCGGSESAVSLWRSDNTLQILGRIVCHLISFYQARLEQHLTKRQSNRKALLVKYRIYWIELQSESHWKDSPLLWLFSFFIASKGEPLPINVRSVRQLLLKACCVFAN